MFRNETLTKGTLDKQEGLGPRKKTKKDGKTKREKEKRER